MFATQTFNQTVTITNNGGAVSGPVDLVLTSLSSDATLANKTGTTSCSSSGNPYITVLASGSWGAGQSMTVTLQFRDPSMGTITYSTAVLAGSAQP